MQRILCVLVIACFTLTIASAGRLQADLENNQVIDRQMAERVEALKEKGGYSSEDFNACQITWTVRPLEKNDPYSSFEPHEVTFRYENRDVVKLVNSQDGKTESIQGLGLNCLEFNNYVYLFFDTLDYGTRVKFGLSDLAYVIYSTDQGGTWSELKNLDPLSSKAKFVLPHNKFEQYVKIFGNARSHVLSIFNLRDETTYLFDPEFKTLKVLPVYNRLTNFDYPADFYWHNDILYLVRGSCEQVRGQLQCPSRTCIETSKDFGATWDKKVLPFRYKSYFLTINSNLYQIYMTPCRDSWFGLIPAINRTYTCGNIQAEKLDDKGQWEKPKTLMKTAAALLGVYKDTQPILVWRDYRFHKKRLCGFIPLVGCIDSVPVQGPNVVYAGELNVSNWQILESIIAYEN